MDILKLRCFVKLSECLSFSLAAYELNISQSSLSKHIMSMEGSLGVKLFERSGRNTVLTELGKELSVNARNVLMEYDRLVQRCAEYNESAVKTTMIGMAPMGCQYFWLRRFDEIMQAFPKLRFGTLENNEIELVNIAIRDEVDYLIIRKEILPAKGFRTHLLHEENAVVMMSESNPLSQKKLLTMKELADQKFIFVDEFTSPYKIFYKACKNAGFDPNIVRTIKSETSTRRFIQDNEGICLTFPSDTNFFEKQQYIRIVPLEDRVNSEIVLAVPSTRKLDAAEKFLAAKLNATDKSYL